MSVSSTPQEIGYVLYAPSNSNDTFLIDKQGKIQQTWYGEYPPGMAVYLLPDGNVLRAESIEPLYCGYPGGRIAVYGPGVNGASALIWAYTMSSPALQQTHDVFPMKNGNVLVCAWELISYESAVKAGRTPDTIPQGGFWSGKVIELNPDLQKQTASEVWSWRFWDHVDDTGTSPRTLNVNQLGTPLSDSDWIHMNAVTYNEELDQIMVSSRNLNEIYIIDHSCSTAEASGHTGGKYRLGGDFLYRWGCPRNYGAAGPQQLFGQHSPYWIPKGFPYEGQIMINNDGYGRSPGGETTADVIDPPVGDGCAGYLLEPGKAFGPAAPSLNRTVPRALWNTFEGSAQMLPDGNILMCAAQLFEVSGEPATFHEKPATFYEMGSGSAPIWSFTLPSGQAFRCHQYSKQYVDGIFSPPITQGATAQ
jgi:hypothetical protein